MDKNDNLRKLPRVDDVVQAARKILDGLRADLLEGKITELPPMDAIAKAVAANAMKAEQAALRPVINATGIVLHTNLGRAPLAEAAAEAAKQAALGYVTLEYDLVTGRRGGRMAALQRRLTELCGCEAALCVNNNAAAVLLTLSALCRNGDVIVSRGELVEIGGSFRIPDVISQGGATLVEVGATNKTHLHDYEFVLGGRTSGILKVHTSNYRIVGFTQDVGLAELYQLARDCDVPLIYDLGGGAFVGLSDFEPTVQEIMAQGVDVLCFSGDKLLGGPQCGIILGRAAYIKEIRLHPLYRALRLDKMSIAALDATLRLYAQGKTADVPTLRMLTATPQELEEKAKQLMGAIGNLPNFDMTVTQTGGLAGGGSLPTENLPSYAVAVSAKSQSDSGLLHDIERKLRGHIVPIIARIHKDRLLFDVRTIEKTDFAAIAHALQAAAKEVQQC